MEVNNEDERRTDPEIPKYVNRVKKRVFVQQGLAQMLQENPGRCQEPNQITRYCARRPYQPEHLGASQWRLEALSDRESHQLKGP